jgi:hypothetical protein
MRGDVEEPRPSCRQLFVQHSSSVPVGVGGRWFLLPAPLLHRRILTEDIRVRILCDGVTWVAVA